MSELVNIDQQLFQLINTQWAFEWGNIFFPAITDLHKTWPFKFVFVPILLALFYKAKKWNGVIIFFGLALSMGIADHVGSHIKHFFERPRPFEVLEAIQRSPAGGFSFPSNHAINMFAMLIYMSYFFPNYRWLYWTIAVLVSFSRIYNGVHYPSDILGGIVIGSIFGLLGCRTIQEILHKVEQRKRGARG